MLKTVLFVLVILGVSCTPASRDKSLPFTFTVTERMDQLPDYVSPPAPNLYNSTPNFAVGWGIDSPIGSAVIDGEVWVLFNLGNQYGTTVKIARFKGANFEHTVRQSDGLIQVDRSGISTHFLGGMWYDESSGMLYAPLHCEYDRGISPPAGWSRKKTRLAVSSDKGETWRLVGDILTGRLPEEGDWLKYSGAFFEAGTGDIDLYVDVRGGYFYIYSSNACAPKNGRMNYYLWYNEVARCAISDKMAPGKWFKYCNGEWKEPGLGGKASRVMMDTFGIYGRIIYSDYLKKYLRIGLCLGANDKRFTDSGLADGSIYISTCTDLAKQEWSPKAKLFDDPQNHKMGITLTDGAAIDPFVCGRTLRIYNYWLYDLPSRAVDVEFAPGRTAVAGFPPYGSYSYEPLPESGDALVSRKTRITGCASPDHRYSGAWSAEQNPDSYQNQIRKSDAAGSSVEFSFHGAEIYWRAIADKDGGKADVFIDGRLEETVDCYYQEPLPLQFAFIRKGLDAKKPHTIKIVVREERNPRAAGAVIRHMAFEHAAESYRASAGFSSVMGKNQWFYQQWNDGQATDLRFHDFAAKTEIDAGGKKQEKRIFLNAWGEEEACRIGADWQAAGLYAAARTWISPRRGKIRIEGIARAESVPGAAKEISLLHNRQEIWRSQLVDAGSPAAHDSTIAVEKNDAILFIVKAGQSGESGKIFWDPVITFIE